MSSKNGQPYLIGFVQFSPGKGMGNCDSRKKASPRFESQRVFFLRTRERYMSVLLPIQKGFKSKSSWFV